MQKILNQNIFGWLFLVAGLGGALFTSKWLGDFAFEVFQDLPRNFSGKRSPHSIAPPPQKSGREIVVAVIDTGIDQNHPLLRDHLWKNPGESGLDERGKSRENNGVDDDGNGFVDDVYGWNFAAGSKDVSDHHGHGTHIAGIILGLSESERSPRALDNVKIMPLKYYDPQTPGLSNLRSSLRALRYAVDHNVDIINYSGGGLDPSLEEEKILREAEAKGILVVAAAGNEKSNCDDRPFYPASYKLKNLISVTAIDGDNLILPSSNFGQHSIDIAAPGYRIVSTKPGGGFGPMTGTSQATAYVTAIAARLLVRQARSLPALKRSLLMTAKIDRHLEGKIKSGAHAQLARALAMRDRDQSANDLQTSNTPHMDTKYFNPHFAETVLTNQP